MADHFLIKTPLAAQDLVAVDGVPAIDRFAELHAALSERAGPEIAALFAEPLVSRGNDLISPSVSWYCDFDGDGTVLSSLEPAQQKAVTSYLSAHLKPLRNLAGDPEIGALVRAALSIPSLDHILVVGDRPVIVNWGHLPAVAQQDAAASQTHFAATLGRFVSIPTLFAQQANAQPDISAPAPALAQDAPATPAATPVMSQPVAAPAVAVAPGAAAAQAVVPQQPSLWVWLPLVLLLSLATLTLIWLLVPGTRLFHQSAVVPLIAQDEVGALSEEVNRGLRARRATLQAALDGAQCMPDGSLVLPNGVTPEGLTPPNPDNPDDVAGAPTPASPEALLPPPADQIVVPDSNVPEAGQPDDGRAAGETTEPLQTTLLDLIEASTVLVLAQGGGSFSVGSGFVVGPGYILTNYHVIQEAMNGRIMVTNASLGTTHLAEVIKASGPIETTGNDYALLRITDASLPIFTLHLPNQSLKLTNVIAAGFPGDVLSSDSQFDALTHGDRNAVPDLTLTDGAVNTEQALGPETHVLVHSAPISAGNSGGPLVDMCGRVVGVNTFVRQGPLRTLNFALAGPDIVAFLRGTPVETRIDSTRCQPTMLRPGVTAAPAPDTEAAADAVPDAPEDDPSLEAE